MAVNRTSRVYKWEAKFGDWETHSLKLGEVRTICRGALAAYGLGAIPVKSHPGDDYAFYYASDEHPYLSFPKAMQNKAIALHESAHHICDHYYGRETEEHGPEWLGIYLWLLAKGGVAPRSALEASVKEMGLKWKRASSPKAVMAKAA